MQRTGAKCIYFYWYVFISWPIGFVVADDDYALNGICVHIQIPILNTFLWSFFQPSIPKESS